MKRRDFPARAVRSGLSGAGRWGVAAVGGASVAGVALLLARREAVMHHRGAVGGLPSLLVALPLWLVVTCLFARYTPGRRRSDRHRE